MRLVIEHREKEGGVERVPHDGDEGEREKQYDIEDEEGSADRAKRGVYAREGDVEEKSVDDASTLKIESALPSSGTGECTARASVWARSVPLPVKKKGQGITERLHTGRCRHG